MGWFLGDVAGHEGFVVAVVDVPNSSRKRELAYPADDYTCPVREVQVACECGWRSPRMTAPVHTRWAPFSVHLSDHEAEDLARAVWELHVSDVPAPDALLRGGAVTRESTFENSSHAQARPATPPASEGAGWSQLRWEGPFKVEARNLAEGRRAGWWSEQYVGLGRFDTETEARTAIARLRRTDPSWDRDRWEIRILPA